MDNYASQLKLLVDLENRHEELLRRLTELDRRVEGVLKEWLTRREPSQTDS